MWQIRLIRAEHDPDVMVHVDENGWQNTVIIIPVLLSASTLVVVSVILWKSIRRNRKKKIDVNRRTDELDGEWAVNSAAVYEYTPGMGDPELRNWELPEGWNIHDRVEICNGQYGPISRAVLSGSELTRDTQRVVLKELSDSCSPGEAQDFNDFMKFHVKVCNHKNLVQMLWCQTARSPLCIFLKEMNPGNLLRFLWKSREVELTSKEPIYTMTEKVVYSVASQVASGLEYLSGIHDLTHGFVAACNVLVHEDMSAQLCGLGTACIMYRTGSIPGRRAAQVPLKWQAPESLQQRRVTEKSDVWSFGVLLYEMITLGDPPYPDLDPKQVLPKLEKNYRMEQPEQCSDQLYELMTSCWQWDDSERPCFTEVLKQLNKHLDQADGHTPLSAKGTMIQSHYEQLAGISL
ncbi:tyrosine-protein kinase STYK1-like [Rhinophrynus dorsalis]